MQDMKKIYIFLSCCPVLVVVLVFFLILMVCSSSSSDSSAVPVGDIMEFNAPFKMGVNYTITSPYGSRKDPFTGEESFHSGIDLAAPVGTEIVASASGTVYKTGYEENGLGNYVKLEHTVSGVKYYTAYGHMSDNSIVVSEGQIVTQGQKLGIIGRSGRATGVHVHFMLMTPNCTYNSSDLKDPQMIIDNDLARRNKYKLPTIQPRPTYGVTK